jgi:hypothetical protein
VNEKLATEMTEIKERLTSIERILKDRIVSFISPASLGRYMKEKQNFEETLKKRTIIMLAPEIYVEYFRSWF